MNQQEAIEAAKKLNDEGHRSFIGQHKIKYVAQNADGAWHGFYEKPEIDYCEIEWEATENICLDREWNDDWENTLAEVK